MNVLIPLSASAAAAVWVLPNVLRWRKVSRNMRESDLSVYYDLGRATSDSALVEVMAAYPHHVLPAQRWAEWPIQARDFEESLRRGLEVESRFPREVGASMVVVTALLWLKRIDEAEDLVRAAAKRFPRSDVPDLFLADIAGKRGDWPEAARIWAAFRARSPEAATGYVRGMEAAAAMHDPAALDRIAEQGLAAVAPKDRFEILSLYAQSAHDREDWGEAARRWAELRTAQDLDPRGYIRGSEALAHLGRKAEADELHAKATFLFPRHPELAADPTADTHGAAAATEASFGD